MKYPTREIAKAKYRENPASFFDAVVHDEVADERDLINPDWPASWSRYHYNLVENGIIRMLRKAGIELDNAHVLDVGSGTGHWVDFFHAVYRPESIVGVDFASCAVDRLNRRYAELQHIAIEQGDITVSNHLWNGRFRVVNAIGIIFHIVDDDGWKSAIKNLGRYVTPDGLVICGGDFSDVTQERGVMRKTRSLQVWRETLEALGYQLFELERYDWWGGAYADGLTDNLLAFRNPETP